jgi:hypothetical protein
LKPVYGIYAVTREPYSVDFLVVLQASETGQPLQVSQLSLPPLGGINFRITPLTVKNTLTAMIANTMIFWTFIIAKKRFGRRQNWQTRLAQ